MASTSGVAMLPNTPNFLGALFNTNVRKTQFLSIIGGTDGANALITTNPEFPISVDYAIDDPSQPTITETQAVGAATPTYFTLAQSKNVIQIFQEDVTVSNFRQRASGRLQGINTAGQQPEENSEIALQLALHLEKMKRDMNWTAINGTYADGGLTSTTTAMGTRGILEAIVTNSFTPTITTDEEFTDAIDEMIKAVYDKGMFNTPTLFVNSTDKVKISKAYHKEGLTEVDRSRFVAGVAVERIVTNFGLEVFIVVDADIPANTILLADVAYIRPVFTTDNQTGEIISIKPLSQRGGETYTMYAEFGLEHGQELNHAKMVYTEGA